MSNSQTEGVVIDASAQKAPLTATASQLRRLLEIIEKDILPKTTEEVANGNKVFGAAVLTDQLGVTYAGTNTETTCPLFHGEVKVIYEWSQIIPASERGPSAQSSIFLSTHEPCCMCISSIVWAGFPCVYYLFPYSITADQGIPHDIRTMHELWGVNSYRKQNRYCSTACIMDLIDTLEDSDEKTELLDSQKRLIEQYDALSKKYHTEKSKNANNSLVLG